MPEWALTLFGVVFGGSIVLVADYLRHRRSKIERYQEVLIEKCIAAHGDLLRMLIDLHADLSPLQLGAEPLRWPKDKRVSPNVPKEEEERAKRVDWAIHELRRFAATNQMLLGPQVMRAYYGYIGGLLKLRTMAKVRPEDDVFVSEALLRLLDPSVDEIAKAVQKEVPGGGIEFVSTAECGRLVRKGQKKAKDLVAEAKAEIESGPREDA